MVEQRLLRYGWPACAGSRNGGSEIRVRLGLIAWRIALLPFLFILFESFVTAKTHFAQWMPRKGWLVKALLARPLA